MCKASRYQTMSNVHLRLQCSTSQYRTLLFGMLISFVALTTSLLSKADEYRITQLATIESAKITPDDESDSPLRTVVTNPFDSGQIITANEDGVVSLFDIKRQQSEALAITNSQDKSQLISIALHPNFTQKNELGYATLFTSHIEPKRIRGRAITRIDDSNEDAAQNLARDAVIYAWQFSVNNNLIPMSAKKREVFRISVEPNSDGISNMRFNPYVKPWQDNFGVMYISVNRAFLSIEENDSSNAILRFRPEKFGLKSYTLVDNGITPDDNTHSAILIGNLGRISYFTWNKHNENHLQIAIDTPPSIVLVEVPYGQLVPDLTQVRPLFQLKSSEVSQAFLTYHEKAISQLRHHLLYLIKRNDAWELTALNANQQVGSVFLWQLPFDIMSDNGNYSLLANRTGNLMLVDFESRHLFSITSHGSNGTQAVEQNTSEPATESTDTSLLWLLFIPVCGGLFIFWQHSQKTKSRKLLRRKYARFTFDENAGEVRLFKRHAKGIDATLPVKTLSECKIVLNSKEVLCLSSSDAQGFDTPKETALNKLFIEEKRRKMIGDEVRKVEVIFVGDDISCECCVYLREGNQRYTKAKFADICEYLIDWCWFYSTQVNPAATGKRKIKPKLETPVKIPAKPKLPVNKTESSATSQTNDAAPAPLNKHRTQSDLTAQTDSPQTKVAMVSETPGVAPNTGASRENSALDSQIIESLDKLSRLKQQGHLTEEEFNKAKAKLLRDLTGM